MESNISSPLTSLLYSLLYTPYTINTTATLPTDTLETEILNTPTGSLPSRSAKLTWRSDDLARRLLCAYNVRLSQANSPIFGHLVTPTGYWEKPQLI